MFSILSLIVIPLVASPMLPPPPVLGASGEAFAAWFAQHRTGFLIGNYLGIAAFIPGFVQLAVVAGRVRHHEGPSGWLGGLVLASGTFTYSVFGCSLAVFQALPFLLDPRSTHAMLAMGTLASVWFALDGLAAVPLVLAVGWATVATGALPRWFATMGWVVAALGVFMSIGALVDQPAWLAGGGQATFAGFVGFFAWTLVLGVICVRERPPDDRAGP